MNGKTGVIYSDVKKTVDDILDFVGNDIVYAMTLALGKPILLTNELYRRAKQDPSIKLKIITALALERPRLKNEIEKRFVGPLVERVFEGTPEFEYMHDFRDGKLPKNVEIYEFFSKAGGYMGNPEAQQNHINSNYTHVVRDGMTYGINVFGQLVGCREIDGKMMYSMGCNTDICIEALKGCQDKRLEGEKVCMVAEVNENMPFMYGDAVIEGKGYDILLHGPEFNYPLFGPPKDPIIPKDYMIGLNVSTLIKDGGTIQVGIGALGDAIAAGLDLRQKDNEGYRRIINRIGLLDKYGELINNWGGLEPFEQGLYGSSEMFVDAFMQLYKAGILKRKVFDSVPIMKLMNEGKIAPDKIPSNILELLLEEEGIHDRLRKKDFDFLVEFGILKEGLKFEHGHIIDGTTKYNVDLADKKNLNELKKLLGTKLKGGTVILGAFFIGPRAFYNALNAMSEEERMQFGMSGVDKVNQLYGDEKLRSLQRKDGRFVNAGMILNAFGAVASDQLEDGRVVSGIGGQYNFVSMAHALPDGRLIMMIRSTRTEKGGKVKSNIVYNYGHCSIPKHLRDIVVTEYGIADLRGKTDKQVIDAIIRITDSRFQEDIVRQAKKAGKLPQDYQIPPESRNNTPARIEELLGPFRDEGYFSPFPFGTDYTDEEIAIGASLKMMVVKKKGAVIRGLLKEIPRRIPSHAMPYLQRLDLHRPAGFKEKVMQKLVLSAMRSAKRI